MGEVCDLGDLSGNGVLDVLGDVGGTGAVLGVGQLAQAGVGVLAAALGLAQLELESGNVSGQLKALLDVVLGGRLIGRILCHDGNSFLYSNVM